MKIPDACVMMPLQTQGHSMMPRGGRPGYIVCVYDIVCVCMRVCVCMCISVYVHVCVSLRLLTLFQQHYLCSHLVLLLLGVPNLATGKIKVSFCLQNNGKADSIIIIGSLIPCILP